MKLQDLIFIILGVALILIFLFHDDTDVVDSRSQMTIDSLKKEMVKKEVERAELDSSIKSLQDSLIVYDQKLQKNQLKLRKIKKDYDEALDSLRHLSAGGIQDFFTKRYAE